jgi:hypothetical protein
MENTAVPPAGVQSKAMLLFQNGNIPYSPMYQLTSNGQPGDTGSHNQNLTLVLLHFSNVFLSIPRPMLVPKA